MDIGHGVHKVVARITCVSTRFARRDLARSDLLRRSLRLGSRLEVSGWNRRVLQAGRTRNRNRIVGSKDRRNRIRTVRIDGTSCSNRNRSSRINVRTGVRSGTTFLERVPMTDVEEGLVVLVRAMVEWFESKWEIFLWNKGNKVKY